ncbi:hypothetical protein HDU97_006719 [Phlyctochytrium planicorne]|nr:hypothetical protein HDU97_006719 [Phlyctochytrium planicorne]
MSLSESSAFKRTNGSWSNSSRAQEEELLSETKSAKQRQPSKGKRGTKPIVDPSEKRKSGRLAGLEAEHGPLKYKGDVPTEDDDDNVILEFDEFVVEDEPEDGPAVIRRKPQLGAIPKVPVLDVQREEANDRYM